jgi:hypothetical protein
MPDDNEGRGRVVALGTVPRSEDLRAARRANAREPDITAGRGLARHGDVIITEAYDESDGTSRVRHAGEHPKLHQVLLTERAQLQRHRVTEEQRSRRLLAWLAAGLLLGAAAILAFAPQATNVYLGAAFLLVAAGAFGLKSFRVKMKGFELDAGERASTERRQ